MQPNESAGQPPPELDEAWSIIRDKVGGWLDTAVANLPNFLVAIVVVVAFWLLARLVKLLLRRGLRRTPIAKPVVNLTVAASGLTVLIAGMFIALGVLGLDKTVTSLLAGVGIIGLALGFAFQDIAANFIAGIVLSIRRPAQLGDLVETNDFFGTVDQINLRSTLVKLPTGQLVYIPNKDVFEKPIVNYTKLGKRRVDIEVGVSYGDDLNRAKELAISAVDALEMRRDGEPVELFYTGFGASSIDFVVRFWIDAGRQADYMAARDAAILAVKQAFDEGGITIPFPIRTLDFGIVGGQSLAEVLPPRLSAGGSSPRGPEPATPAGRGSQ